MRHRFGSSFAVSMSGLSLLGVSVVLRDFESQPQDRNLSTASTEGAADEFPGHYDMSMIFVANIPNPSMCEESWPIIDLLNRNEITWMSEGSLSASLAVSKSRAAEARKLLKENFPWVELVDDGTGQE